MRTTKSNLLSILFLFILLFPVSAQSSKPSVTEDYRPVVVEMVERGDRAMKSYSPETAVKTGNEFSRIYFDVFESSGMEFTLGLKDKSLMEKIEFGFSQAINLSMEGKEKSVVNKVWNELKKDLYLTVERYPSDKKSTGFWGMVLQSFLILAREGAEAMLVVAALVAYLRRSGFSDKIYVIWQGVIWAVVASVVTAWLLTQAFHVSGESREAFEGITMLLAAAVLIYVSYWLFSKRDAEKWQAFIHKEMNKAISRGSLFALGLVAFLAVFREGAETILFYQALIASATGELMAVWTGMGLAVLGLALIYFLVRLASIRLPLKYFFSFTAVLLFVMAFIFTGKGLLELQVSGWISTTSLNGWPQASWLGLFPTLETLFGQLLVLVLVPLGWLYVRRSRKTSAVQV